MLVVETIAKIRREYFAQKKPIRAICREFRVSRKVVRKVIRSEATEFRYERGKQPLPRIDPWRDQLDALLLANEGKSSRERLTLIRIFEELRGLGYEGSYDAVRRYARKWHIERGAALAEAYVPLSFAPGEAYQFDWSHEVVLIGGTTVTVKVAHVRLCHSRMLFVRAYPRESQEMVFDAHIRAFAFFKGTCTRGIYDNMKTAVDAVFVGKDRRFNRRFVRMCSHYLVEPVACTPASGWEKGQVENQVGLVRERFFTPRLRVASYDELNAWLLDRCVAYAKAHKHPELTDCTIWQAFEAERPKLVPITSPFDGFHRLAERFSIRRIVLAALDVRLNQLRGDQLHRMAERLQQSCPVITRTAGFDPDQGRGKLLEKYHHLLAPKLLAQNRCLGGIHPVKLENVLRRVHPNSANLFHGRFPLSEICNDLILARSMPSGAVHSNR